MRSSLAILSLLIIYSVQDLLPQREPAARVTQASFPGSDETGQMRFDRKFEHSGEFAFELAPDAAPAVVAWRLHGPVRGYRIQAEGQPAVGDLKGLVRHLTRHAESDRDKAEALFRFVVNDIKDWYYPAQGIDLTVEDLGVLIWGFGFGFCYDLGRLQAGLWHQAGLRSRIVGWPQHTVAEVFYEGAWHLYDLQHRSFYLDDRGQVASFAQIKENPQLLFQGLNEFGLDAIGYPPHHMAKWYAIADPKFQDSNDGPHWKTNHDFALNLRHGEYFEVVYSQPGIKYHPDSWAQYYGEMTLRKDPPWPLLGRLVYAPSWQGDEAEWVETVSPEGTPAMALSFENPYLFTEGWIKLPKVKGFVRLWVEAFDRVQFVGRLVHGNAIFSRHIAGSNDFKLIVEKGEHEAAEFRQVEMHARLQISPLGLPQASAGANRWPVRFDSGRPLLSAWVVEQAPDLVVDSVVFNPPEPKPGELVTLECVIANRGMGASGPVVLSVFNNTTSFLSETVEQVAVHTLPPIEAGERLKQRLVWRASTQMTWYGQNPFVQLFDIWIDKDGEYVDLDRDNNRRQVYLYLRQQNGDRAKLPGYQDLPGH